MAGGLHTHHNVLQDGKVMHRPEMLMHHIDAQEDFSPTLRTARKKV